MKKIFLTLTAITIGLTAFAQSELAGNWTFQGQESISGKLYTNGSPKSVKITVNGNSLTFDKITAGNGQDITSTETVAIDGKPAEITTASKRKKVITLKKNGSSYTEFMTLHNASDPAKMDHKQTDQWSVTDGQLLLDRKDENGINGEVWESKATYVKK